MKLTTNFDLAEFTVSQTAARFGMDNNPPADVMVNLLELAGALEIVRARLGFPIVISSGYRSPDLNKAVGGAPNSAHVLGWAADITCPGFGNPLQVARAIAQIPGFRYDQVIHEFGAWCHLSVDPRYRMQTLTIDRSGTRQGLLV
jgi:zinc D-Ala-D-Ala carboxypeptidase